MDSLDQLHHILVIEDPSFKREINLDAATYSIGRHSSNDIVLSCQKTSRNHATLLRRTDLKTNKCAYWILDGDLQGNRSRNGIYINGKKSLVHELKSGDEIQFSGDAQATYLTSANLSNPLDETPVVQQLSQSLTPPNNIAANREANKENIVPSQISLPVENNSNSLAAAQQNSLAELCPQAIIEIDLYGNITYINSAGIINFKDIHHQKLNHPLLVNLIAQYHKGHDNIINREVKVGSKTFQQAAHYLPDKRVIRNYVVDISIQVALESQLKQKTTFYNHIKEQIFAGIIIFESATKKIVEVNSACSNLLGYSQNDLLQMSVYELGSESGDFATVLQDAIVAKKDFQGECSLRRQDNSDTSAQIKVSSIDNGLQAKICLIIHSLAEYKNFQPNILNETVDLPHNLAQREIFNQQIVTAIANAKRSQKLLSIMFCQVGSLLDVQATIGSEKTSQMLSTLKDRLHTCLRAGDTVIQWEEDKFAMLLPQITDVEEVAKINQRVQKLIEQTFKIGKIQVNTKSTTGISIYPQDGLDGEILLASAGTALERASQNKNSYQFYDEATNSQALVTLELENLLQQGIDKKEFKLFYQPQININTGELEAIEALLRWQHPELGLVAPNNFMLVAENSKLIVPIGEWTIRSACTQNKAWQSQGLPFAKVTVSLSSVQFQQPDLIQEITDILDETNLEPHFLEIEISAVTLMENVDHSMHILNQLRSLGVHIAVDSFTAGFSTLEYLKQFPLNTLKLDRSLVQGLTNDAQDLAIVAALIELGKGFNLRVVAEGVETQEQVELLRNLDCQQMQGYWFGHPLAADEASKLLQLNHSNHPEELEIGASSENRDAEEISESIVVPEPIDNIDIDNNDDHE